MSGALPATMEELTPEVYARIVAELQRARARATEPIGPSEPPAYQPPPLKPVKPDVFRGGRRVASWLFTLEQYYMVMRIVSEETQVLYATSLLRDTAADWWRGVTMAVRAGLQPPVHSWLEFKNRIIAHFQPIHEEDFARQHIRTLKQTGGVREYVNRFQTLILQIPTMDERSKVDAFISGLKVDVRRWVKLQDPRTLEAALTVAERYQTMLMQDRATMRTYTQLAKGTGEAESATPMELGFIGQPQRKQKAAGGTTKRNTVSTCWSCGEPGHLSNRCPKYNPKMPFKPDKRPPKVAHAAAEDSDDESVNA